MVLPTFGAAGTYLTGGNSTTADIAVPSGVAAGQHVFVHLHREYGFIANPTVTPPAGFAAVGTPVSINNLEMTLWWKLATGADSGTYTFSWGGLAADTFRVGLAWRCSGGDIGASPVEAFTSGSAAAKTSPTVAVNPTTLGTDRLVMWANSTFNGITYVTMGNGFTIPTNGNNAAIGLASKGVAAQGAVGSTTCTFTGATDDHVVAMFALKPFVSSTPGVPNQRQRRMLPQILR